MFNSPKALNKTLPGTNSAHTGGFVTGIRLRTILKIRVRSARAVNAYIPGGGDVRAAMRLRHDGNHGDAGSRTDGLGAELGEESFAVGVGERSDHFDELGGACEAVLAARGGLEGVEVHVLALVRELHHGTHDLRDCSHARFLFAQAVGLVPALAWPWGFS